MLRFRHIRWCSGAQCIRPWYTTTQNSTRRKNATVDFKGLFWGEMVAMGGLEPPTPAL